MHKISPEATLVSSQAFFIHNNPGFRSGFTLLAQYKAWVCDFAGGAVQGLWAVSHGNLCYWKSRDQVPFPTGAHNRRRAGEEEQASLHVRTLLCISSEHWLLVWGLQAWLEWKQQLHQSCSSSWLDWTNSPHTSARHPCTHTLLSWDSPELPGKGWTCTHIMVGQIPHRNCSKSIRPTTHLQDTLQRVGIGFPFHLENRKCISALPLQEHNFVPPCLCPWSFLRGKSLSLLLQKGLGAYAGNRLKGKIKRGGFCMSDLHLFWENL